MSNTLKFGNGQWATKEGSTLAYNDENNNFKPLPFNFERGSSATVVNKDGLIETVGSGEPRIDYKDDSKGALKLEPTRSNLVTYSEDFSDSYWYKSGTYTITNNYGISPDGTNNSTRIQGDANTVVYRDVGSSTDARSIYVKATSGSGSIQLLSHNNNTNNVFAIDENWKRVEINSASVLGDNFYVVDFRGASTDVFDIEIYGAQLEAGSYPTSYIPTQGSVVTRLADSCSQTPPNSVIGQTEGSIYAEFKSLDNVSNLILWMRNPSGGNYGDMIKLECDGDNRMRLEVRESNVTSANLTSDVLPTNTYYKVAVAYKQNDFVMYLNGVQISVDTSGNVPTCSEMYVGKYIDAGIRMGVSKDLKLYNTRLSNSELAALTQV